MSINKVAPRSVRSRWRAFRHASSGLRGALLLKSSKVCDSVLLLALALTATSCVTGEYNRTRELIEPAALAFDALEPGSDTLTEALQNLGAPLHVWEIESGAALAWYWIDSSSWGLTLSVPASDAVDASFSYGEANDSIEGVVLFFDKAWTLTEKRRGNINAIAATLRRPADLSDDEDEAVLPGELEVEAAIEE